MKKQKYAACIAVAGVMLALGACTSKGGNSGGTAAAEAPQGDSVVYYDKSGGDVTQALNTGTFKNFSEDTGVSVLSDFHQDATKFFAGQQAKHVPWSIAQLNIADVLEARKKGYIEKIDPSIVPLDKLIAGTYDDYSINTGTFAMLTVWNATKFPKSGAQPTTMADLYDTKKFPGKRCFGTTPHNTWVLESALLADGVKADKLYPLDVDRALSKLDTIKDDIVWWQSGAQSIQNFQNGSCDLGIIWSARALTAINDDKIDLGMSWDGAGYSVAAWFIPKGAPNPKAAQKLLAAIITDEAGQKIFVDQTATPMPAGLSGTDASSYVESVQPFLAMAPNTDKAIASDFEFYAEHGVEVAKAFNAWKGK